MYLNKKPLHRHKIILGLTLTLDVFKCFYKNDKCNREYD